VTLDFGSREQIAYIDKLTFALLVLDTKACLCMQGKFLNKERGWSDITETNQLFNDFVELAVTRWQRVREQIKQVCLEFC
jgi:hypothetical protein